MASAAALTSNATVALQIQDTSRALNRSRLVWLFRCSISDCSDRSASRGDRLFNELLGEIEIGILMVAQNVGKAETGTFATYGSHTGPNLC
jgi:hypothetical protein